MSLTVYPTDGYDSFISLEDANTRIGYTSLQASDWNALDDTTKEVYLRIATIAINNKVDFDDDAFLDYDAATSCLPNACADMAVHDLVYGLSSEINPNTGLVASEKVGDLEVKYFHGANTSSQQLKGRVTTRFPDTVVSCLSNYGAVFTGSGIKQSLLDRM